MVKGRQLTRLCSVLNLTDRASTTIEGCQAGRLGQIFQHMREYNAESPKQDSKRFNSQGRRNSLPPVCVSVYLSSCSVFPTFVYTLYSTVPVCMFLTICLSPTFLLYFSRAKSFVLSLSLLGPRKCGRARTCTQQTWPSGKNTTLDSRQKHGAGVRIPPCF